MCADDERALAGRARNLATRRVQRRHQMPAIDPKRHKPNPESVPHAEWYPPSVTEVERPFDFASSTFHSLIPLEVQRNPREAVVLGVDEAGRGPVVGPMVYGVAYCLELYLEELPKFGFADSKTLKEDKRHELFALIETAQHELNANVGWATRTMTARDILSGMLQSQHGKGAYNLNEQAHDTTIRLIREVLQAGVNVTKVFVDTVGPPALYQAKLLREFPRCQVTVAKKADSVYPIVSTASVVAKVTRDLSLKYCLQRYTPLLGQLIGSGYPSDPNTAQWLNGRVDRVFGWDFGLVRFLWQTARDSLVKKGAANVVYEEECVKPDLGYAEIGTFFAAESAVERGLKEDFYGAAVLL